MKRRITIKLPLFRVWWGVLPWYGLSQPVLRLLPRFFLRSFQRLFPRLFPCLLLPMFYLTMINPSGLSAALLYDPSLHWQTVHSPHFTIHFYEGEETIAQEVATIAERVHAKLYPFFNWQPKHKVDVILTDRALAPTGFANIRPNNRITLHLKPVGPLVGPEDALEWLFTHEYIHILHLDKGAGKVMGFRAVFGRNMLLFPNTMQPAWFLEGLASYGADFLGGQNSLGLSTTSHMQMRMEVLNGVKPVYQVNQPITTLPATSTPYLYGEFFYKFLADTYGQEKIAALVHNYSNNVLPYFINSNSRETVGKSIAKLWEEFTRYLNVHYQPQIDAITKSGIVGGVKVNDKPVAGGLLSATADGTLYFVEWDRENAAVLKKITPGSDAPVEVMEAKNIASLDAHADAGLLVAKSDWHNNTDNVMDLYIINPSDSSTRRITENQRYHSAAWRPDGEMIAAIRQSAYRDSLHLLSKAGEHRRQLWEAQQGEKISSISWSPDGTRLITSMWRRQSGWNLAELDVNTLQWRDITHSPQNENMPVYADGGDSVVYSSDADGVYNLYKLDLHTGETQKLSNVIGGAFKPVLAKDGGSGDIYYSSYEATGSYLYRLPGQPMPQVDIVHPQMHSTIKFQPLKVALADAHRSAEDPPAPTADAEQAQATNRPGDEFKVTDYRPTGGLAPTGWMPFASFNDNADRYGFVINGSDVLRRHSYNLRWSYDTAHSLADGEIRYAYDGWYPLLRLGASRENLYFSAANSELKRIRHSDSARAELIWPLMHTDRRWALHTAIIQDKEYDAWRDYRQAPVGTYRDRLVGAGVVYDSTERYPMSISTGRGTNVAALVENSDVLDSDFAGTVVTLDTRRYFNLGKQNVVFLRLLGGKGDDRTRRFRLGGSESIVPLIFGPSSMDPNLPPAPFNKRSYALRGYKSGLAALSGHNMLLTTAEWRFPIARVERGLMLPPIALDYLWGKLFVDYGDAWDEQAAYHRGVGVELNVMAMVFYRQPMAIRWGYAHGERGKHQTYLDINVKIL